MSRQLTAGKLLDFLLECKRNGTDLDQVPMNYCYHRGGDILPLRMIATKKSDSHLKSVVLFTTTAWV